MKIIKLFTLALVLTAFAVNAQAKPIQPAHVYMFGFSASFSSSDSMTPPPRGIFRK